MRRLLFAVALLLLASPALAQTGDCAAETGTSTVWAIIGGGTGQGFVDIRYDFYAAGLLGQTTVTRSSSLGDGVDASAFADSQCEALDVSRTFDELTAAQALILAGAVAETVIPAYPEVCARAVPTPNGIPGGALEHCRMAEFHAAEIREVWDLPAEEHLVRFNPIWEWVARTGPTGPGFNAGNRRDWFNATQATWNAMDVEQAENNIDSLRSGIDIHNVNFKRPWQDQ